MRHRSQVRNAVQTQDGVCAVIRVRDGEMQHFEIRLAIAEDCPDLFDVHRQSVRSLCSGDYTVEQIDMWLDGRHPGMYLLAIERGELWVAVSSGTVLGLVEVQGNEVTKLFVSGAAAGAGVGKALLSQAIAHIRQAGENRIYLESTLTGRDFYRKLGFTEIGTGTFSHGPGTVSLEIVQMELHVD
ncbi:GNAT family N-acetyltransferase [Agrobacterium vitis]|uniref:GNAT family N-acetyltransferase n=2 Tax=Agrobacterium vitis TaxID=373 RepID=A0A6L6VIH8_AGRVI|nr:GNAT family N-acetyltransferase [Agrobacterium vitis]